MPILRKSYGWIFWAVAGFAALSGCMQEPVNEYYLRLSLNDSLSPAPPRGYDSVEIVLISSTDSSKVLATVFTGPLVNPGGLPPYRLPEGLREANFVVRVRAYRYEGQLALETLIGKSGSNISITHSPIIAPSPYSLFLNSLEIFPTKLLIPPFDTSTTDYEILVPLNLDTVQIYPNVQDTRAKMYIDNDTTPWFLFPPLYRPVSLTPTLMDITVKNHNRQLVYHLTFKKDPRGGPHLRALKTSPGSISPAFQPDSLVYSMTVPTTDSVFRIDSLLADPSVTLILANRDTVTAESLLAGFLPTPFPLALGNNSFRINLSKFGGEQNYVLNVYREYAPQLIKFKTADNNSGGSCPFCGNYWSPAFQPAQLNYLQSSVGLPQIFFDSLEAAPGYSIFLSFNSTTNFNLVPSGTLPGPITMTGGTDIIRIRISKTGLVNPPVYIFTLAP